MKLFLVLLLGAALMAAGCASQAHVVTVTPAAEVSSALVGTWFWYPSMSWPMHDSVQLEIIAVDAGRGRGIIRSMLLPEQSIRLEVLKDGEIAVSVTKTPVTFNLQFVRIRTQQGTTTALSGPVKGYPSVLRLEPQIATFFRAE